MQILISLTVVGYVLGGFGGVICKAFVVRGTHFTKGGVERRGEWFSSSMWICVAVAVFPPWRLLSWTKGLLGWMSQTPFVDGGN